MEVATNEEHAEDNKISKRKLDKTVLDHFSNLLKPQENVRIKSSLILLRHLTTGGQEKVSSRNYIFKRYTLI